MKGKRVWIAVVVTVLLAWVAAVGSVAQEAVPQAVPLGTSFTYQGQLTKDSSPVHGACDLQLSLWDAVSGGSQIGGTQTKTNVSVSNGLFTVELEAGPTAFLGNARWLGIAVRCPAGSGAYTTLTPRQALTAAPYALYAARAGNAWLLNGNTGTTPGTHYLGTSDNQALEIKVSGARVLRLEPHATSPNLIGGYSGNSVTSGVYGAVIGGGGTGGLLNRVTDAYGMVGGGERNQAGDNAGTAEDRMYATVSGGYSNTASGNRAAVGGGGGNDASGSYATVGGGDANDASGGKATVGGGYSNTASSGFATVGGGDTNTASGDMATVGGGYSNTASGDRATVGGGGGNTASGDRATVGGGGGNTASSGFATVGGGYANTASGGSATVSGGFVNAASGDNATVAGGVNNTASGYYATVPGGRNNVAAGVYSFAVGRRAKANHEGAFVWGDATDADIASTAANQFVMRATGGARLYGGDRWDLATTEGDLRIGNDTHRLKIGVALSGGGAGDVWFRAQGGSNRMHFWSPGGLWIYTNAGKTSGMYLAAGGSSWNAVSDRGRKENLAPVDSAELLARLAAIEISTWNYKAQDPAIRHIGPMADQFNALVDGLGGEGGDHINSLDSDGVALAAIQGLYAENQALKAQVAELDARLSALEAAAGRGRSPEAGPGLPGLWLVAGGLVLGAGSAWAARRRPGGVR
jgi:trimeric autotransporter adhesin